MYNKKNILFAIEIDENEDNNIFTLEPEISYEQNQAIALIKKENKNIVLKTITVEYCKDIKKIKPLSAIEVISIENALSKKINSSILEGKLEYEIGKVILFENKQFSETISAEIINIRFCRLELLSEEDLKNAGYKSFDDININKKSTITMITWRILE